jgi:hypothetical protein
VHREDEVTVMTSPSTRTSEQSTAQLPEPPTRPDQPRGWRKHPLTRFAEAVVSAFFFALTVLPVYAVVADGHSPLWLAYAVFPAIACYIAIADAVRTTTRTPREEAEVNRRFAAAMKNLGAGDH